MSGLKTACLYSITPHRLGFCGPLDSKPSSQLMIGFIEGKKVSAKELKKILHEFVSCEKYYNLIAKRNLIADPFSQRVVKAYWLGNGLLDKAGWRAHHSWHVYKIGSVTDRIQFNDKLRDLCRISWGQVKAINKKITIEYQPIVKIGKKYILADPIVRPVEWSEKLMPNLKKGDTVSIHWNKAVAILTSSEIANLEKYTLKTLANL